MMNQDSYEADERDRADMLRLAAGQDTALNALMERHATRLLHYLVRSLQNEEDAADLAQETFVRVYQHRAKFDTKERFSIWLYAIASNLVRSQFRYRARHATVSLEHKQAETGNDLREALPDELRTPLILSEYEDLSHSEIGAVINCSSKAVETRLYRARKQLRQQLDRFLRT